jgi:diguanylate cyclase (GGDEF)-like protein/PAS domain S-box-containing protein
MTRGPGTPESNNASGSAPFAPRLPRGLGRVLNQREGPPLRREREIQEGLAELGYDTLQLLQREPAPASRWVRRVITAASAGAIFVLAPLLATRPVFGVGGSAAWLLDLFGSILLAVQWGVAGAAAGVLLNFAGFVLLGGDHGIAGFTYPHRRDVLVMSLLVNASIPLLVGRLSQKLARFDDTRRLSEENKRVSSGAQAAVRASEERFRSLIQNASDVVTVLDADGIRRYVSPSVERMLGYGPDELIGTSFFASVHPDDAGRVMTFHLERLANPLLTAPIEFRYRGKDGAWHHLEASFNNLLREPLVGGIVVNARDVTERKLFQERLAHQAFHDPLTGLPNRALFMDRLEQSLGRPDRGQTPLAVMFLDLDRFKVINDSLGHAVGDALLIEVGKRVSSCLRPGDTVARLGGDEFAVLLEGVLEEADATSIAERMIDLFRQVLALEGHDVYITTSIGIAVSRGRHTRPADILKEADVALYRAKGAGRSCFLVFDPSMMATGLEGPDLEADLRRAVERDQLILHYQPEVDIATGAIVGMEALVRWEHPRYGLIPPDRFIPLAEETGLIISIGLWVLRRACRQLAEWQAARPADAPLVMGVNLSLRQFQQPDLVEQVASAINEAGVSAEYLRLELTESIAMQDVESALSTLDALKRLGVQLAIDDFGTGYSSLSYLRRLPIDTLKIDQSFLRGQEDSRVTSAILQAIIALSHALGMEVTAEGIETVEQLLWIRALHCDRGQGFYYARPVPEESMRRLLVTGLPHALPDEQQAHSA